jgi:hypothetical protein
MLFLVLAVQVVVLVKVVTLRVLLQAQTPMLVVYQEVTDKAVVVVAEQLRQVAMQAIILLVLVVKVKL